MIYKLAEYFLLFIIYSFLGWCMETTTVSIERKKFIDRGFLLGPYCPIYGCGSLLIVLGLGFFSFNPVLLFIMTTVVCSALEYLTSWIMEKVFKARWWDYSHLKFNLNGRICLKNAFAFGILGIAVSYIVNPFFHKLISRLSQKSLLWMAIGIGIIFISDFIISIIIMIGFRKVTKSVNSERSEDNTEQITNMVRQLFSQKSFFHKRFIDAYPKLKAIKIQMRKIQKKVKNATKKVSKNVKGASEKVSKNVKDASEKVSKNVKGASEKVSKSVKGASKKVSKSMKVATEKMSRNVKNTKKKVSEKNKKNSDNKEGGN